MHKRDSSDEQIGHFQITMTAADPSTIFLATYAKCSGSIRIGPEQMFIALLSEFQMQYLDIYTDIIYL